MAVLTNILKTQDAAALDYFIDNHRGSQYWETAAKKQLDRPSGQSHIVLMDFILVTSEYESVLVFLPPFLLSSCCV